MKNDIYFFGEKLYLEITMIGYKNQGESLILTLKDIKGNYLWTAIIDCYKYENENLTYKKLKEMNYGERKIDLLMLTHPDSDHIKDVEVIIENFVDEKTILVMPDFVNSKINNTEDIKKIKECIHNRYNNRKSGQLNNIFYNKNINEPNLCWKFVGSNSKRHILNVETYLPTDSIMTMSRNYDTQYKNDYSLFTNIIIDNKVNFTFTGDCLNYSLNSLNDEDFDKMKNTLYFKIPHHGSKETTYIKNLIQNKKIIISSSAACTYRKNVTDEAILRFYKTFCKDFVSVTAREHSNYKYGILKHVYDVVNGYIIKDKCECYGNACLSID